MLSSRKAALWLSVFLVFERVLATQIPLLAPPALNGELRQWDLNVSPAENATGNLVFETANSLLQHWANTRHRIGHTIVPGTVPVGILLYHGAVRGPHIPTALDWVAVEPDHSMTFCPGTVESGCWHATFAVTRPMKVLYFDGSSGAKLPEGTMDTQDLVAWSEMKPEWMNNERQRIADLCKWGQKYNVDGFVRMQMNFEIMVCDFTSHMEVVSFLNLETLRLRLTPGAPTDLPDDLNTLHHAFELMHSASWRETYPGDTRIILDYTGLLSFYDTALVPSLVPRRVGLERWDHRVGGISPEDIESVKDRLVRTLLEQPSTKPSGIDWKTVLRVVVDRYANRLDVMKRLLNVPSDDALVLLHHARMVQRQLRTVLTPYMTLIAKPPHSPTLSNSTNSWAAPVFRECATTHTSSIAVHGITLKPSERLLLQAVQETTHEICRVTTRMWASGFIAGVDPFYPADQPPEADRIRSLMSEWNKDLMQLMSWLDWNVWVKCRPACGTEEMCYLPTWSLGFPPTPVYPDGDNASALSPQVPDPSTGEWKRPQPKCIRRLEPYAF